MPGSYQMHLHVRERKPDFGSFFLPLLLYFINKFFEIYFILIFIKFLLIFF